MMNKISSMIRYGVKKGIRYRANLFSWILADLSLYASVSAVYLILFTKVDSMGGYNFSEIGLYISTYFVINNLFAVFFSEAVSAYSDMVLNGKYLYLQMMPLGVVRTTIMLEFNFSAFVSTPFLLAVNFIFIIKCQVMYSRLVLYYLLLVCACGVMQFLFFCIYSLLLYGIRSSSLSGAALQIFTIAEKPDTIFSEKVRKIFTYCIPAFMLSAVETRILLGRDSIGMAGYMFMVMAVLAGVFWILTEMGEKVYKSEGN